MKKEIIIGSDHGGFPLKESLKPVLEELSFSVTDVGCYDTTSINYPEIGKKVSESVASGQFARGILICGSGLGMSIIANRFKKIRATLCNDHLTAKLSRQHNDSNILVLGARVLGIETATDILHTWLNTEFDGGRHLERINMFDQNF